MSLSDTKLLKSWRGEHDADAFTELVARHAAMVYGTCMRVARNRGLAEEIAQECFVELMQTRGEVRSPGGWLHTVATRRSLDRLKAEGRRQQRERVYAESRESTVEPTWDDTRQWVDEAIEALPEDLRTPIVMRFLEGQAQTEIAETLEVSRKTVRLRIQRGVEKVRETLAKQGIVVPVATLGVWLEEAAGSEAPPALVAELGKRVLATPVTTSASTGALTYMVAAIVPVALAIGGYVLVRGDRPNTPTVQAEVSVPPVPSPALPPAEPDPAAQNDPAEASEHEAPETAPEANATLALTEAPEEERLGWKLNLTPSEETRAALAQNANVQFENTHIQGIMEFVHDYFDVNVALDSRVVAPPTDQRPSWPSERYITDGQVRSVNLRKVPLEKVLNAVLAPLNLVYKVRGNTVWVSSSRQITRDLTVPLPSAPFREGKILDQIASPVNIEFEDIHITDVFEFLSQSFQLTLHLDHAVVAPEVNQGDPPPEDVGRYATDGMIPYINLKNSSVAETLYVLTRLLDLTYRVEKDGVYVSTLDRIDQDF